MFVFMYLPVGTVAGDLGFLSPLLGKAGRCCSECSVETWGVFPGPWALTLSAPGYHDAHRVSVPALQVPRQVFVRGISSSPPQDTVKWKLFHHLEMKTQSLAGFRQPVEPG